MNRPHIVGIQIVAQGLGDLVDAVVFVGGAVETGAIFCIQKA